MKDVSSVAAQTYMLEQLPAAMSEQNKDSSLEITGTDLLEKMRLFKREAQVESLKNETLFPSTREKRAPNYMRQDPREHCISNYRNMSILEHLGCWSIAWKGISG